MQKVTLANIIVTKKLRGKKKKIGKGSDETKGQL